MFKHGFTESDFTRLSGKMCAELFCEEMDALIERALAMRKKGVLFLPEQYKNEFNKAGAWFAFAALLTLKRELLKRLYTHNAIEERLWAIYAGRKMDSRISLLPDYNFLSLVYDCVRNHDLFLGFRQEYCK